MSIKYLITAAVVFLGVILNYAHIRVFRFRFNQILNISAACFAMVVVWELFLIYQLRN